MRTFIVIMSFGFGACATKPNLPSVDAPVASNDAHDGRNPDAAVTDANDVHSDAHVQDATPGLCDVAAQTGCAPGAACSMDNVNIPEGSCTAPGGGTQGTGCNANTQCNAGFWCTQSTFQCTAYCLTSTTCPTSAPTCQLFPHGQYGVCT